MSKYNSFTILDWTSCCLQATKLLFPLSFSKYSKQQPKSIISQPEAKMLSLMSLFLSHTTFNSLTKNVSSVLKIYSLNLHESHHHALPRLLHSPSNRHTPASIPWSFPYIHLLMRALWPLPSSLLLWSKGLIMAPKDLHSLTSHLLSSHLWSPPPHSSYFHSLVSRLLWWLRQ